MSSKCILACTDTWGVGLLLDGRRRRYGIHWPMGVFRGTDSVLRTYCSIRPFFWSFAQEARPPSSVYMERKSHPWQTSIVGVTCQLVGIPNTEQQV